MKYIENREVTRICTMIKSGDDEMRNLACSILKKKETFRFSWLTICIFHCALFLGTLTVTTIICNNRKLGLVLIPVITALVFQVVLSTLHCILIWNMRKRYNREMKNLSNG